jgi:hypothetical protein
VTPAAAALAADSRPPRPGVGRHRGPPGAALADHADPDREAQPAVHRHHATGPAAAWAFEAFDPGTGARSAAWRLTGRGWRQAAFPGRVNEQVITAASSSASNVWAFSNLNFGSGGSRALRWNGHAWTVLGTFGRPLAGAAVLGPRDVWAFGEDIFGSKALGARHWNGHGWTAPPSGPSRGPRVPCGRGTRTASAGRQAGRALNGHVWKRTSVALLLPPTTMFVHSALIGVYEWRRPASGRLG